MYKNIILFCLLTLMFLSVFALSAIGYYPKSTSASALLSPTPISIPLPERPVTLPDIQSLLQVSNEACQLPCFWGVRPGYTTEEEIIDFLQPVAIGENAPELHYAYREGSEQDPIFYIDFGVKDEVVSTIFVSIYAPSEWMPTQTLELPFLLSIMPSTPQSFISINLSQSRFFVTFAFNEGMIAQYAFELRVKGNVVDPFKDNPFLLCPSIDLNDLIILRLRDGDIQSALEENGYSTFIERDILWPIERMTGMKVEDFVKQIAENPNECIELPSYPDLIEMGYEF